LYLYDESEDIQQIRQKIGEYRSNVDKLKHLSRGRNKKSVWKQFEMDRQNNVERQERILVNHNSGALVHAQAEDQQDSGGHYGK
jgi:hypothetical protein